MTAEGSPAHYSRKRRVRSRAIPIAALLFCGPALAQDCGGPFASLGPIARVRERLEIELPDGRLLAQTGLAPFSLTRDGPARFESARRALEAKLHAVPIEAATPLAIEDRWGRITGQLRANSDNLAVWLASSGLARAAPAAGDPCGRLILNAEAKARQAKLGLWADPYYSVLAAVDVVALTARSGEFVLVEGRVLRLGQTSARFYLDFGPARGVDLSVTVSKTFAKSFAAAGVNLETLQGQRVRVRGTLDHRPGPTLDLVSPFALELLGR